MSVNETHPRQPLTTLVIQSQRATTPRDRDRLEGEVITLSRSMSWGLAHRYAHRGAELDDLRAVADVAVLGAARRFDGARGEFIGYASVTVLGEIKKYFRDYCWTVRPTRAVQELQALLPAATIELQHHGTPATVVSIARHLDVAPHEVREAAAARGCFTPISLDAPPPGESQAPGRDIATDEPGFELSEDRLSAAPACAALSDRERDLLRLRFFDDLTQQEIADLTGSTQMQVSRELRRILACLRSSVSDAMPTRGDNLRNVAVR